MQGKRDSFGPQRFPTLRDWIDSIFLRGNKTHDYTEQFSERDYVFEPIDDGMHGYMTGQGRGLKRGDDLLLGDSVNPVRYRIVEIDYYSEPSTVWIARLKKLTE